MPLAMLSQTMDLPKKKLGMAGDEEKVADETASSTS
jgi:hypothetical protein